MIAPHLEEMSNTIKDVLFLKVDVDQCEDIAAKFKVTAMPTFVLLKTKSKVADMKGADIDKLKSLVAKHRSSTFQGEGNVLGSTTPTTPGPTQPTTQTVDLALSLLSLQAQYKLNVDQSIPMANVKV